MVRAAFQSVAVVYGLLRGPHQAPTTMSAPALRHSERVLEPESELVQVIDSSLTRIVPPRPRPARECFASSLLSGEQVLKTCAERGRPYTPPPASAEHPSPATLKILDEVDAIFMLFKGCDRFDLNEGWFSRMQFLDATLFDTCLGDIGNHIWKASRTHAAAAWYAESQDYSRILVMEGDVDFDAEPSWDSARTARFVDEIKSASVVRLSYQPSLDGSPALVSQAGRCDDRCICVRKAGDPWCKVGPNCMLMSNAGYILSRDVYGKFAARVMQACHINKYDQWSTSSFCPSDRDPVNQFPQLLVLPPFAKQNQPKKLPLFHLYSDRFARACVREASPVPAPKHSVSYQRPPAQPAAQSAVQPAQPAAQSARLLSSHAPGQAVGQADAQLGEPTNEEIDEEIRDAQERLAQLRAKKEARDKQPAERSQVSQPDGQPAAQPVVHREPELRKSISKEDSLDLDLEDRFASDDDSDDATPRPSTQRDPEETGRPEGDANEELVLDFDEPALAVEASPSKSPEAHLA